jgi:hypothetical protein
MAIRKRRMVGTWVPGPPGLSCTYIDKDAPFGGWVSRGRMAGRGVGRFEGLKVEGWKVGRLKDGRGPLSRVFS